MRAQSHRQWSILIAIGIILLTTALSPGAQELSSESVPSTPTARGLSAADLVAAQKFGETLSVADWLGPLAPVALSPFFGIACLSAMALYGQSWIAADNAFLGEGSPLADPGIFWVFLILTVITSVPRLTKVSKPFAQAVDQIETWAGIITMLTLRFMIRAEAPDVAEIAVIQMGLLSFGINSLLMLAAIINILVINTVRFFFEVLIWITPVPTVDAIFEMANKTLCAALMVIYGFSPTLATVVNLAVFTVALFLFGWAYRRQVFFHVILLDAVWAFLFPPRSVSQKPLIVFPVTAVGPVPARARCTLTQTDSGWTLKHERIFRGDLLVDISCDDSSADLIPGFITNCVRVRGATVADLTFSRWYNVLLPKFAVSLNVTLNEVDTATVRDRTGLKAELT
ncbi:MAG: hypothetical protein GY758_20870 [Fuerstiella sp.]|jgi:hypothetical protein|nr:hypothetical protein [Fuerstiella sp.]MCP4508831.1 hypothetical protein [Fuerstiella sp.]MDG2129082.1 hypothetical protein [Fuerstiella sp.]